MSDPRTAREPDAPQQSEYDRAEIDGQRMLGHVMDGGPKPPSRSKLGRILDALESVVRSLGR